MRLERAAACFFGLFLFGSAFSIAMAQITLGLTLCTLCAWKLANSNWPEDFGPRLVYTAIGAYVSWLAISSLAGASPLSSLISLKEEWLFVILPVGIFLGRHRTVRSRLIMALAIGALLAGTYGVIQHFTGVHWFKAEALHRAGENYRLAGNFSHPLTYGYFVATSSVFLLNYLLGSFRELSRPTRLLILLATLACLTATTLSTSRGPLLSLGVGLIATALMRRQFVRLTASVILAGLLVWISAPKMMAEFGSRLKNDFNAEQRTGRLYIWNQSWQITLSAPITGVGPGNFGPTYSAHLPDDAASYHHQGHAHNDFLNLSATTGFPGLVFYLTVWGIIFVRLWRRSRDESSPAENRALAKAALLASLVFCTGSLTEAAFADEELRQLITALWAFGFSAGIGPDLHHRSDPEQP